MILVVLESVAARWASLNGGLYDSTPNLNAESARGLVFDNFYAHIGRSSNSLVAILLSTYPKLGFRDVTEEYPQLPGTSLASVFRDRGYRTAFVTPSDLSWAGWGPFLKERGFGELRDLHQLGCPTDLFLGRRRPLHGGRDDRLHQPGAGPPVLRDGVDDADASSL